MSRAVQRRAEIAVQRQVTRIAAALAEAMPDARVVQGGGDVVVEARGAIARAGWVRGMIA